MSNASPKNAVPNRRRPLFLGWLLAALAVFGLLIAASLCPIGWRPHLSSDPNQERFWAFAMLGLAAKFAAPRRHWSTIACVVLIAAGAEAAQLLAPGRHARLEDGTIKAVGAIVGVQMGFAFFKLRRAWRRLDAAGGQGEGRSVAAPTEA
jgi:hypothetical protein